jgi:hypothetical protein
MDAMNVGGGIGGGMGGGIGGGGVGLADDRHQIGRLVASDDIIFSPAFSGLLLYLTRLLEPFWEKNVLNVGEKRCSFNEDQLNYMKTALTNLREFISTSKTKNEISKRTFLLINIALLRPTILDSHFSAFLNAPNKLATTRMSQTTTRIGIENLCQRKKNTHTHTYLEFFFLPF